MPIVSSHVISQSIYALQFLRADAQKNLQPNNPAFALELFLSIDLAIAELKYALNPKEEEKDFRYRTRTGVKLQRVK